MAAKAKAKANGHSNGSLKNGKAINGGVNGNMNGQAVTRRRTPPPKAKAGFMARLFSIAARLVTWYSILTVLFRCPPTLDACTEDSPKICKPYFQAKQAVLPHVTPYYDAYAAPYVDLAKPYYDTVDRTFVTPARTYAVKYGGPQLAKAQDMGLEHWEKTVQPQLIKYQALAKVHYDQSVAPHVDKATVVVGPYYELARTHAQQAYDDALLPAYLFVQPYALQGYDVASTFTTDTAVPTTIWAWNKTYVFLDSAVWPRVRNIYVKTVDPQVARIMERLGRHSQDKKIKGSETDSSAKSSFNKPSASVSSASAAPTTSTVEPTPEPKSTVASVESDVDAEPTIEVNVQANNDPSREEIRAKAAKTVAEDLELWQGKFTKAADDAALEIEERVAEITDTLIKEQAEVIGKPLVLQLEKTATAELADLKKTILSILEKYKDAKDRAEFDEEVAAAVRATGLKIRDQAQAIRTWRTSYEEGVHSAVTELAEEHIRILEGIRDLALQKLGMKWAWMDGITYKDWQKFHALRERLDEWTEDLKRLVATHPGIEKAQVAGTDVENEGMAIAGETAQELAALKQVAAWKAIATDFTNNFDADAMKQAAETAQEQAAEAIRAAAAAAEEGAQAVLDKVEEGAESINEAMSEGASSVKPKKKKKTKAAAAATPVSEEDTETSAVPPMESMASEPTHSASDLDAESASSEPATKPAKSVPTPDVVDGPEQVEETIVASPEEPSSAGSATPSVKSAMFGAAAQSVPSRQPILDDDEDDILPNIGSVTSAAQAAYTNAIAQAADKYSSAMSVASAQIHGEPKPAHEEAFSSVRNVYFDAMATANSQLQNAMTAASEGIYGTPTTKWVPDLPTMPSVDWEKVQSIAQQNLQDSVNWAGEQYESAKVAIGAAEPSPSTAGQRIEKLMDNAKHNYYAGLGLAHARYSEFLAAASTAVSSVTATPTPTDVQGSASSAASVASASAASAAAAATDAAAAAASAAGEAAASAVSAASNKAAAAGDSANEGWDFVVSRVSSQIYGAPTPTPWYENLYAAAGDYASQAGEYAASATDAASDYATSAGEYAADSVSSATSVAGDYADAASSQYAMVSSLVSELVMGKEPTFTESVYSRLAGAYGAATSTVGSVVGEATDAATAAASSVADQVKEKIDNIRDEL